MADQPVNQNASDEIDLGQLFQMIGSGFNKIGILILRVFLYLKKHALILIGLIVIGVLIGYGLKRITNKKMQVDVILRPNLESKDYLYDVVDEIDANLKAQDVSFFEAMGIQIDSIKGFEISIEPVKKDTRGAAGKEFEYLEILQKFENTGLVSDVLREEVLKNTELNHRITFKYKHKNGLEIAEKLIEYINSNDYFIELIAAQTTNAKERIENNKTLIGQIDTIIANYSKNMNQGTGSFDSGKIVLDNEERLNIRELFDLKNALVRDMENQRMELIEQATPIRVINFGKPHQSTTRFFGKKIILIPVILLSLFFLFSFLRYLNQKAVEMDNQ